MYTKLNMSYINMFCKPECINSLSKASYYIKNTFLTYNYRLTLKMALNFKFCTKMLIGYVLT